MTGKERLLTVIKGDIPDRVPVSFFVQEEFLSYLYPERKDVDRTKTAVECADYFGFDVMTRGKEFEEPYFMKKSFPGWEVVRKRKQDTSNIYLRIDITTPKGTLTQLETTPRADRGGAGIHSTVTEWLLKDEKDFENFAEYIPNIDNETVQSMRTYAGWVKESIGERGIASPWAWSGVYNQASFLRGMENIMIDPYVRPEFYGAYMNKVSDLMAEYCRAFADTDVYCIGIQGNIANSSSVGSDYFNTYILPYEKKIVNAIQENGTFTLYHNCGKARVLWESYKKLGIDIWETVTEPPFGDSSLADAKKAIGDSVTLAGNLDQVVFLKEASEKDVEKRVCEIMAAGKPGGRYIFSGSDFLEKDTPFENIRSAVTTAIREGAY